MLNRLDGGEVATRGWVLYLANREAGSVVPIYEASDESMKSERVPSGRPVPTIPKIAEVTKVA